MLVSSFIRSTNSIFPQILDLANARPDLRKKVFGCMDKYAERGLRSLAVARQVLIYQRSYVFRLLLAWKQMFSCLFLFLFRWSPRKQKKVQVHHGNLLAYCLFLTLQDTTVLKPFVGLWILVLTLRWSPVTILIRHLIFLEIHGYLDVFPWHAL